MKIAPGSSTSKADITRGIFSQKGSGYSSNLPPHAQYAKKMDQKRPRNPGDTPAHANSFESSQKNSKKSELNDSKQAKKPAKSQVFFSDCDSKDEEVEVEREKEAPQPFNETIFELEKEIKTLKEEKKSVAKELKKERKSLEKKRDEEAELKSKLVETERALIEERKMHQHDLKRMAGIINEEKSDRLLQRQRVMELEEEVSSQKTKYEGELLQIVAQIRSLKSIQLQFNEEKHHSIRLEALVDQSKKELEQLKSHLKSCIQFFVSLLEEIFLINQNQSKSHGDNDMNSPEKSTSFLLELLNRTGSF